MVADANMSGVHCVLYALFDANGNLDRDAMALQVQQVLATGVSGIVVLGLATEVHKLSVAEQEALVNLVAKEIGARVPLGVTVTGDSVAEQRHMVRYGLEHGASWFILQPPRTPGLEVDDYLKFYRHVAEGFGGIFALQNAPQYLGRSLGASDIMRLGQISPAFRVIKCETSAVELAELVDVSKGLLAVMNGRGGLEMTDCLRAGAGGFVLAPDIIDRSLHVYDLWQKGQRPLAEAAYKDILPAMTFMMQSIEHLICYGKRMYGLRAGVEILDRQPALVPTDFGLECLERWAGEMGKFDPPAKLKIDGKEGDDCA